MKSDEISKLALLLVPYFGFPEKATREVPQPPLEEVRSETRRRTVIDKEKRKVDGGPSPNLIWILVLGGVAGAIFIAVLKAPGGIVGAITTWIIAIGIFSALRSSVRVTKEIEVDVPREVVETHQEKYYVDQPPKVETYELPPRYSVAGVGRGRMCFAAFPLQGKSIVVSAERMVPEGRLSFPILSDETKVVADMDDAKAATSAVPYVLASGGREVEIPFASAYEKGVPLKGEELAVHDALVEFASSLQKREVLPVDGRFLPNDSPLLQALTKADAGGAIALKFQRLSEDVAHIDSAETRTIEQRLLNCWKSLRLNLLAMHGARYSALRSILEPASRGLGVAFEISAFNFYCPSCNSDSLKGVSDRDYTVDNRQTPAAVRFTESTRCCFEPDRQTWRCLACESTTSNPIAVHKALDEALMPTFDRLMEEHKVERLSIYSKARDDMLRYQHESEKEVDQLFQAARSECEQIVDALSELTQRLGAGSRMLQRLESAVETQRLLPTALVKKLVADSKAIAATGEWDESRGALRESMTSYRDEIESALAGAPRAQRTEDQVRDAPIKMLVGRLESKASQGAPAMVELGDDGPKLLVSMPAGVAGDDAPTPTSKPATHSLADVMSKNDGLNSTHVS